MAVAPVADAAREVRIRAVAAERTRRVSAPSDRLLRPLAILARSSRISLRASLSALLPAALSDHHRFAACGGQPCESRLNSVAVASSRSVTAR